MLEHGKYIETYRELEEAGRPTPIQNRPAVEAGGDWFIVAFQRLSKSRGNGMNGPLPIAISEISRYWRDVGHIGSLEEFIAVIQALDEAYLQKVADLRN